MKNFFFTIFLQPLLCWLCVCTQPIFAQVMPGKTLYDQASSDFKNKSFDHALVLVLQADSIFQREGTALEQLKTKILLAQIYNAQRRPQLSITVSEAAVKLLMPAGKRDSLIEADLLNAYGGSLMELRRFDESETSYRRAIAIKQILGKETPERGVQISNLANMFFKKGDFAQAMQYGKEGILIREQGLSPNPTLLTAYTNLGIIHKQVGLYQQALVYYKRVELVISSNPETYNDKAGPLYQGMANVYHDLGDLDQSKAYNELTIKYFSIQAGAQSLPVADVYYNLALWSGDLNDIPAQIDYAQKALNICQNLREKDTVRIANCYR